jgi:hypothetical protein
VKHSPSVVTPKLRITALGALGALGALAALTGLSTSALSACGDATETVATDRLAITAAALTLGPIGGSSYGLTVKNADTAPNNVVWSKSAITSSAFGDGRGAISYVGPCDATRNPHTVELVLESLAEPGGGTIAPSTYRNPAPADAPLILSVMCAPNADTPVVFNLTIMRDASQGFFDIAVNFQDIFCSAKVDCVNALLHDGDTRGPTVVLGFACTAGTSADGVEPTWLHISDVVLECAGQPALYFDPTGPTGNNGPLGAAPTFFQTATYRGQEALPGLDKCYWNSAFGVKVGNAPSCRLRAQATASHASFSPTGASPANTVYPYVDFDVVITNAEGGLACTNNALNVTGSGVQTRYSPPTGAAFSHEWECGVGVEPVDKRLSCAGQFEGGTTVAVLPSPEGFSVTVGGVRSSTYELPDGAFIGNDASCCVNPCCDSAP